MNLSEYWKDFLREATSLFSFGVAGELIRRSDSFTLAPNKSALKKYEPFASSTISFAAKREMRVLFSLSLESESYAISYNSFVSNTRRQVDREGAADEFNVAVQGDYLMATSIHLGSGFSRAQRDDLFAILDNKGASAEVRLKRFVAALCKIENTSVDGLHILKTRLKDETVVNATAPMSAVASIINQGGGPS